MPVLLPGVAGRVRCRAWCYDPDDPQWGWYWALYVGGERVNGGLAFSDGDARWRARGAYVHFLAREHFEKRSRA